jgi:[acyl-carrier-protein] S-malonyltransferase
MYAIVFPGQGSQVVGMSVDFRDEFPAAREVFEEANSAAGFDLAALIEKGPEDALRRTQVTQPAILTATIAIYRVIESQLGTSPGFFAGHSLGEYSALVAAGALELRDAVRLVQRRGEFMQQAVVEGEGSMAAILGLDGARIAEVCASIDAVVAPANFNTPEQTVIAGDRVAVDAASEALLAAGAKRAIPLDVSAPFHCERMQPAMQQLAPLLDETCFRAAEVPVISNVTCEPYREPAEARELLRRQVCAPVRWIDGVRRMIRDGVELQLEIGPGRVLSGMAARIDRSLVRANVATLGDLEKAVAAVAKAGS